MSRFAIVLAAFSLASTAALARTEDRDVAEFDAVQVAAGIHATVEIGPRRPVRIDADDQVLPLVETRVENGELHIGFKPHTSFHSMQPVTVTIQTPQLRGVGASGGSIVRATFTRANEAEIDASGGSEIRARGVDAGRLLVSGSGGSKLNVQGRADTLRLEMSGGTELHGQDLSVKDAQVHASGGSTGEFRANGNLRGNLSGGSELHVRGQPKTKVATSGGSSVEVED
jgi:hypothetical protein